MKGNIKIGEHDVEMLANGLTPVLYRRIFHKDFLMESQNAEADLTIFQELGFVMARQAEEGVSTKDLMDTSIDAYYEWLQQYEAMDVINSIDDIVRLYSAQSKSTSAAKKKRH